MQQAQSPGRISGIIVTLTHTAALRYSAIQLNWRISWRLVMHQESQVLCKPNTLLHLKVVRLFMQLGQSEKCFVLYLIIFFFCCLQFCFASVFISPWKGPTSCCNLFAGWQTSMCTVFFTESKSKYAVQGGKFLTISSIHRSASADKHRSNPLPSYTL